MSSAADCMIPRRPLLLISVVVLTLHALVLGGAMSHGASPSADTPLAFATRTIAAPPPRRHPARPRPTSPPLRSPFHAKNRAPNPRHPPQSLVNLWLTAPRLRHPPRRPRPRPSLHRHPTTARRQRSTPQQIGRA